MNEKQIVSGYIAAGFHALVVTDHYSRDAIWYSRNYPEKSGDDLFGFLQGYHRVKAEGECRGLRVFKGAELRFDESINDYLLIGYRNELLQDPEAVFAMGLAAFSEIAHKEGAFLVQAHPCRSNSRPPCFPANVAHLDAIEVFNGNPRAQNHNPLAEQFAHSAPHLIRLSGSDCHQPEDIGRGGIYTGRMPEDEQDLIAMLRNQKFTMIK